jgi:multiple sugar transport system permease protein
MVALPLFWGIYLSFQKVDLFGPGKFVGWSNYVRLFDNKIFLQTIWNTCYFVLLTVPALVVIGLILAMALNQQTKIANVLPKLS